jgi:hypothetical protein
LVEVFFLSFRDESLVALPFRRCPAFTS